MGKITHWLPFFVHGLTFVGHEVTPVLAALCHRNIPAMLVLDLVTPEGCKAELTKLAGYIPR